MQFLAYLKAWPRGRAVASSFGRIGPHDWAVRARLLTFCLLATCLGAVARPGWAHTTPPALRPAAAAPAVPAPVKTPWAVQGVDVDGDGKADFANPTGQGERGEDHYGSGQFGARRDAGERRHEGVDFISTPGQVVNAPMAGYVSHIGFAYVDDRALRSIEITNRRTGYVARILYVDPDVAEGQTITLGQAIGSAQDLTRRYPDGITNHVHVQVAARGRGWRDAATLIPLPKTASPNVQTAARSGPPGAAA